MTLSNGNVFVLWSPVKGTPFKNAIVSGAHAWRQFEQQKDCGNSFKLGGLRVPCLAHRPVSSHCAFSRNIHCDPRLCASSSGEHFIYVMNCSRVMAPVGDEMSTDLPSCTSGLSRCSDYVHVSHSLTLDICGFALALFLSFVFSLAMY